MKPKNFPGRKLARQTKAQLGKEPTPSQAAMARAERSKKDRSGRGKIR